MKDECQLKGVERIDTPYLGRWAAYCTCGTTIFGNTEEQMNASFNEHRMGLI